MARMPNPFGPARPTGLDYESGVSSGAIAHFFNAVYAWMASGLALTAVVAWWVSTRPDVMAQIFHGPMLIGLFIAEIALVFVISAAVQRINATGATALFLLYSALNGLTLSCIFVIYTHAAITSAFLVTAGMFGAMSLYGMVTRRDLSGWGSLLFMALIGLILASVVSMFWHNTMLQVAINYVGVLIFVGLTAYDTQMLKQIAVATAQDSAMAARYSIVGALRLYLDFINLFLLILRTLNSRRS